MGKKIFKALIYLLIFIGFAGQLAIISPSGLSIDGDILFWSSHGHDGMWHIAVSNEIKKGFPLQNPVMAGEKLVNYHFFSDIVPAYLNKFLRIPDLTIYFWIMPFVYSFFLGLTAYLAGKEVGKSKLSGIFSVFAVYFIGSFGYIVTLLHNGGVGGESLFWATQVQSSIGNPPQILSDIFFLAFIYYLSKYLKGNLKSTTLLYVFLILTSLAKVYAGMVILPSFATLALYRLIKKRKFDLFIVIAVSSIISLGLYLPFSKNAGQYLILEPLWYVRRLFSDPGRLGIKNFELIVQHYQNLTSLKSKIGFARYDLMGILLIFFGNLGTRALGLLTVPKFIRKNTQMGIFLLSSAVISYIIPTLFLQKGVATNTSQTFQYMLLVFGVFFAIFMSNIFKKLTDQKRYMLSIAFVALILALSLPSQIGLLHQFYSRPAYAKIPQAEVKALNFLKNNSDGDAVIITPPYNPYLDTKEVPPPIWDWFDTSYVAALSERQVYFADYEQVDIMGYNYKPRLEFQKLFFDSETPNITSKELKDKGISLIYFPTYLKPKRDPKKIGLTKIYSNSEVEIWKVN